MFEEYFFRLFSSQGDNIALVTADASTDMTRVFAVKVSGEPAGLYFPNNGADSQKSLHGWNT